jgi:urea transport system substrate-binding protein
MKRAWVWAALVVAVLLVAAGGYAWVQVGLARKPILVGLLHSQTGAMAISEKSMLDAEVLGLEEINRRGGVLGRRVEWIIADGKSDWPTYAQQAERLISDDHVSVIFGCWTSASRKNVKPVVEQHDHLLIYPMAYEGLEQSPNIIYTGAAPNQQIIPTVKWCYDHLKARRFFLTGSDYVWPHSVNEIIKDQLKALGAELVGERYITFGSSDVKDVVEAIQRAKPDVVLSAVVGDTNLAFYPALRRVGITPEKIPVISFSIAEDELRKLSPQDVVGDYSAWNYFQSIDRPENRQFVKNFKDKYGQDRVTSDVMDAAYNSVWLWAHAVEEAGTDDVQAVRKYMRRQSLNAPEGIVSVDPETQHTWRPFYIAKMRADGQFDIVWSMTKPIRPVPYPITRTRSEWEAFLNDLYTRWGGSWANPNKPAPTTTPG